jgi:hypothetical protein
MAEALRLGCTPDEGPDFVIPAMAQVGDEDTDTDYATLMDAAAISAGRFSAASPTIAPSSLGRTGAGE